MARGGPWLAARPVDGRIPHGDSGPRAVAERLAAGRVSPTVGRPMVATCVSRLFRGGLGGRGPELRGQYGIVWLLALSSRQYTFIIYKDITSGRRGKYDYLADDICADSNLGCGCTIVYSATVDMALIGKSM